MDDQVYCIDCGEDEDIAFIAQYASGDYWKCSSCDKEFHYTIKEE